MPQYRLRQVVRDGLVVLGASAVLLLVLEGAARLRLSIEAPDALAEKSPGAFRILTLGGSTVAGVPEGALGFVSQLDAGLRELRPQRRIEIVNLARSGADSDGVRRTFEANRSARADLVIVLTGHNEFLDRRRRHGLRGTLRRIRDASGVARLAGDAAGYIGIGTRASEALLPDRLDPLDRDDPSYRARLAGFRRNIDAIVATARSLGVPLILCTAPANLADWPPVHQRIAWANPNPDYDADVRALRQLVEADRSDDAIALAVRLTERFGEDAMVLYLHASALRAQSRGDEALALYRRAVELDPYPLRAFDAQNDAIRVHAETTGVGVVDVERLFARHARDGLVGFDLVCDNCHPTPFGNALIARAIAGVMAREGWLLAPDTELGGPGRWLARAERRIGDPQARARAHVRWLLSNAIYAMKTPFHNFAAARDYLDRARAVAPDDWRIHANLGVLSLLEGDPKRGELEIARATRLKGSALDLDDRRFVPYLAEALERAALRLPAPAPAGGS
jgi:tetratricopeptide (TPR) repeat protein